MTWQFIETTHREVLFWDPNRFDPEQQPWCFVNLPFRTGEMTLCWYRDSNDTIFVWRTA